MYDIEPIALARAALNERGGAKKYRECARRMGHESRRIVTGSYYFFVSFSADLFASFMPVQTITARACLPACTSTEWRFDMPS